jgi:GTP pyrophosphokinase
MLTKPEDKIDYTYQELKEFISTNYDGPDFDLLDRAYTLALHAHDGKKRETGHDYITHAISTAYTLAKMKMNLSVVAAGLLHDVVEDTDVDLSRVEKEFGEDIANMVDAVTKLKRVKYYGADLYAENMRRMFMAMSKDVRVVFIKFADRLHNLKTLYARPRERQVRVAKESLEIYAPIARRLGMGEMRGDIEDLAFLYAYPKEFQLTNTLLEQSVREREEVVKKTIASCRDILAAADVRVTAIHGRVKRLYSLYQKLKRYDQDMKRIYDIIAIRIVVADVAECYHALGVIHAKYKPLPGRIKDYIAHPKPNGYQSLHTTVFAERGAVVEFQLRTSEMHEYAEYGVAAHWRYKDKTGKIKSRDLKWMGELADIQKAVESKKDFLEELGEMKLEVFQDRIFVFTPKGDVLDLAEEATPVDFAYAIHSDLGNSCTGARVNEKIANLNTPLQSGDLCEILTEKNRKNPNPDWLKFVKTNHARAKIRAALKKQERRWLQRMIRRK